MGPVGMVKEGKQRDVPPGWLPASSLELFGLDMLVRSSDLFIRNMEGSSQDNLGRNKVEGFGLGRFAVHSAFLGVQPGSKISYKLTWISSLFQPARFRPCVNQRLCVANGGWALGGLGGAHVVARNSR